MDEPAEDNYSNSFTCIPEIGDIPPAAEHPQTAHLLGADGRGGRSGGRGDIGG